MSKGKYTIALAEGDGIGPEIVDASLRILDKALGNYGIGSKIEYKAVDIGWPSIDRHGVSLRKEAMDAIEHSDGLILGPLEVGTYEKDDPGYPSPSGKIRKKFDLYANLRPTKSYGYNRHYSGKEVDILIARENTEGFYADRNLFQGSGEFKPTEDTAMSLRVITRRASARICETAMKYAEKRRKRVTAVHKANVLTVTDGMFLEEFRKVASEHRDVVVSEKIVDAMAFDLVKRPEEYDVVVTTNMYGDILSDEAAFISGSLGLAPSLNSGDDYAMAQAAHGAAPDIKGQGISNPMAMIISVQMLMEWLADKNDDASLMKVSESIRTAVDRTMSSGKAITPDLGGKATTEDFRDEVLANLEAVTVAEE